MNELKQRLKELDDKVYEIIDNSSDYERAEQAREYYLNDKGTPFSLIELGIFEAIKQDKLEIFDIMQKAFEYECYSKHFGNMSLTKFCIFSGLYVQFFKVVQSAGRGKKHLYVIQMSNGSVKIGIAYDIKRRYSQIQASSGMKITEHWESGLIEDAYVLETALHRKYRDKRLNGEYFDINYEEAVEQAQQIAMIGGG